MRLTPGQWERSARFVLRFHTAADIRSSKSQLRTFGELPFRNYLPCYGSCSCGPLSARAFLQVGCQAMSGPGGLSGNVWLLNRLSEPWNTILGSLKAR